MVKIIQPCSNYMIQNVFYTKEEAEIYISMLINKMENYIEIKHKGERIAPLMTIEQMEIQLSNMKQFIIEEIT